MPENTIYKLVGKIEQDIRQSYTGGAVDVYATTNNLYPDYALYPLTAKEKKLDTTDYTPEKLYLYDANSLYPTVMSKIFMPVGIPIAFEGDITIFKPDAYGFFFCIITSPSEDELPHPILQKHVHTKDGVRTVAGIGTWEGWIFS